MDSLQLMRERKNLTQEWVAKQLGTYQPTISQLEAGEVELSPKMATTMAHLYSVPATRLITAHKRMQDMARAVDEVAALKNASAEESLKVAVKLARIETNPAVPAALRKRARKARERIDVEAALVATKNLDPNTTATTGLQVAQDGQGNYYVVDTTTDPPTISPAQFGDLVQHQGTPLGSKAASKSRRDAWGRGNRNNDE